MEFIYRIGKAKTFFFLPTICKAELEEGGYAIVLAWLHGLVYFAKKEELWM